VAAELAATYRVTGVDISPEQIGQAARNVPDAEFVCADARTVTFPDGHFDAAVSLYTFDHIPRQEHHLLLGRLHQWLQPGGLLLLNIEHTDLSTQTEGETDISYTWILARKRATHP
jgi:cyclopropane fatty-acyl-phospholipid synthase-like methyltransferase